MILVVKLHYGVTTLSIIISRARYHGIIIIMMSIPLWFNLPQPPYTVYPKKYAHSFVVLCFVVVTQSFIMNSHEVFIHIHQGCFAGTGAIVRLPQCQWSKPDGYGKISQCITITKHSKAKTVCIFLGIYCTVWCHYNLVNLLQNSHNRHSIDRPRGWGLWSLLWVWNLVSILLLSSQCRM